MQEKNKAFPLFSSRLGEVMKIKSFTQSALAIATKIHQTSISEYLNGKSVPSAAALASISDALGVSMDYLWGRDAEANANNLENTTSAIEPDATRKLAEIAALLPQFSALNAAMSKILANSYASPRPRKKR